MLYIQQTVIFIDKIINLGNNPETIKDYKESLVAAWIALFIQVWSRTGIWDPLSFLASNKIFFWIKIYTKHFLVRLFAWIVLLLSFLITDD